MSHISNSDLEHLAKHGFVVVKDFISQDLQQALIHDVRTLREASKFKIAKIGHDGMIQDEKEPYRDIRSSETCFIGRTNEPEPKCSARHELYDALDQVRSDLGSNVIRNGHVTKGVPLLDTEMEELMYAYYPRGGYYRRHKDAEVDSVSNVRKYSFLLYLNQDWTPDHAGQLRIHLDSGKDKLPAGELPNFQDVAPTGGTLVVFRSDALPHEVLDTQSERIAIVGWYLSSEPTTMSSSNQLAAAAIHPKTLQSLRVLREEVPGLARKLNPMPEPVAQQHCSGLLGDDFVFPSMGQTLPSSQPREEEKKMEFDDVDPRYWSTIATFNVSGRVSTLSLCGQRLRKLDESAASLLLSQDILENVNVLDLGNADLSIPSLLLCLERCPNLVQLHLAGNAYGDDGIIQILEKGRQDVVNQLQVMDLRYNNLTAVGVTAIGDFLQGNDCKWQVLHLEGNSLKCDAAHGISQTANLRELYLGNNDIGPHGAAAIANGLGKGQLVKLYLEANCIGPQGAAAFTQALEELGSDKKLAKLFVDNNGMGKEAAVRLAKALNSATVITGSVFS